MLARIIIVAFLSLLTASQAYAEPLTIALFGAAFAATTAGAIVTFVITAAAYVGGSLLLGAMKKQPQASADSSQPAGIQLDVQMGEDVPIAFTVGTTATGGTRKYCGTWGQDGATPNAYLTDVLQVGDLPAPGEPGIWINGQECTVEWEAVPTTQGYPVTEFRVDGKDHVWVWWRDGTQTAADPFLLAKFSAHPERPFKATMIGRGCPYVVVTALYDRELFTGNLTCVIEPPETPWYDLRKDSTVGGSGAHRWNDPTTWEPTSNNAVIAYNIIRGVSYDGDWIYGGQNLSAFRLPAANWMAAANECDAARVLADGSTEPQFRCGMEVRGNMEPLTVVQELMKACSGRIAEVGGIFKILVGAPGSAVYAFTDGDILVTRGQSYTPFPILGDTHNGMEATYPEPAEMWATKDAPALYNPAYEAADGKRRLATGVSFPAAPFAIQVQQLMRTAIEDDRKFARHGHYLPPDAYPLDPLDVVVWTSARNGYVNKKFLIDRIVGERTFNQMVLLKEIDLAGYGWSAAYQKPVANGPVSIVRPPPQPMTGWQALPATIDGADGSKRPSIQIQYDGNQVDVRAVRAQVRRAGQEALMFDGEQPYGAPEPGLKYVTLNGVFLPDSPHEARGIYVPFSGRATSWSAWLAVTTPNVRTELSDFGTSLRRYITETLPSQIFELGNKARNIDDIISELAITVANVQRSVRTILEGQGASIVETATIVSSQGVTAAQLETRVSTMGVTITSTALAVTNIDGKLRGTAMNLIDVNGHVIGTYAWNDGSTSAFTVVADKFNYAVPGASPGDPPIPIMTLGAVNGVGKWVFKGDLTGDGTIKYYAIDVATITAISGHFGNATIDGKLTSGPGGLREDDFTSGTLKLFGP